MEKLYKIGEISKLYHIGVDSLRYYEEQGLISPKRSESGYRLYRDRDIWRLNVIRDLRELGFGTETIKEYLDFQNVDGALAMLREEQQAIDRKMETLKKLRRNVTQRMRIIETARKLPPNEIAVKEFPERRCYLTPTGYEKDAEMDILIKELLNQSKDHLYIIGNNQFGSMISMDSVKDGGEPIYHSAFLLAESGDHVIPGGRYLSVTYHGAYTQSRKWISRLLDYAKTQNLSLADEILEILWIDIHTTRQVEEYTTELQIHVKE